jgi:hypothetical protein
MREDSRLIIADAVMPPAGALPKCQEEVLRSFDVVSNYESGLKIGLG